LQSEINSQTGLAKGRFPIHRVVPHLFIIPFCRTNSASGDDKGPNPWQTKKNSQSGYNGTSTQHATAATSSGRGRSWHTHGLACCIPKLQKLIVTQLVRKFSFMEPQGSLTCSQETARHLSLFWARLIQSTPSHLIFLRSILILSSHQGLDLPSDLFPSGFQTTILYPFLVSSMHATCPANFILIALIILITYGEAYKLSSSSLCSLLYVQIFSSPLCSLTASTEVLSLVWRPSIKPIQNTG